MIIIPNWPTPKNIHSLYTTRQNGQSKLPFDAFNLAQHVGDRLADVMANRASLISDGNLPSEPIWLDQQHTNYVIKLDESSFSQTLQVADASWTNQPGLVSIVMTADCLPILVTNNAGSIVAAIHAGWEGLQKGIVTKTLLSFPKLTENEPENLMVWIGPVISQTYFEVGQEVYDAFVSNQLGNACCFAKQPTSKGTDKIVIKYLANLPALVKLELKTLGVTQVYGGDLCSYTLVDRFFSYRRSGKTGRMASIIWIENKP